MCKDAPTFIPSFVTADISAYEDTGAYCYDTYSVDAQEYQYTAPAAYQPAVAQAGAWTTAQLSICLEGYSDDSSDDDAPRTPVAKSMPGVVLTSDKQDEDPIDIDTPHTSTGEPESDLSSFELDPSDTDRDLVPATPFAALSHGATFTVAELLMFRQAVPAEEGIEEGMGAKEVDMPIQEELQPKAAKPQPPRQHKQALKSNPPTSAKYSKNASGKSRSDQQRSAKAPPSKESKVIERPSQAEQEKEFKALTSDASWSAKKMAERKCSSTDDAPSTQEVVRSMKSILNKLTLEKFEPLYAKLVSCGVSTTEHLEALIHEVFDKATTQHHFVNMYADLCERLHGFYMQNPISDDPKMTFKKILLNGCQSFFEKHLKPPSNLDKLDEEERQILTLKYKTQMLGNIKFVGALLVRQMLAAKVLFAICEELLTDPTPESLESLAALLTVVGPTFDIPEWAGRALLEGIFSKVKDLSSDCKVVPRVRCLLKDVLELRQAHWQDKKPKKMEGPKTLKEVANTQAAEQKSSGMPCKSPSKSNGTNNRTFQGKSWPGQGQGNQTGRSGNKQPPSPKTAPKESYARINSLAALMGGDRKSTTPATTGPSAPAKPAAPERPRKQPVEEAFDRVACRKEVSAALAELRSNYEVDEALSRITAIAVPASKQSEELCEMLSLMSEEGSAAVRRACFDVVAKLFTQGNWKPYALSRGLEDFADLCPDLKCDIPTLPMILGEELSAALAPLVQSGVLQPSSRDAVVAAC